MLDGWFGLIEPWLMVRGRPGPTRAKGLGPQANQPEYKVMATNNTSKASTKASSKATVPNGPVVQAMSKALAANTKAKAKAKAKPVTKAPAKGKGTKGKAPAKPVTKAGTYADMAAKYTGQSKVESPVFVMWELCNSMADKRRKDVIAAAVAKGISYYTARTQYQLWLTAYRNS